MKEIDVKTAEMILENFNIDTKLYNFVNINPLVVEKSLYLLKKYFNEGLRSLDSLQLSSSINANNKLDLIITSDKIF